MRQLSMQRCDYEEALAGVEKAPLSLALILEPFGYSGELGGAVDDVLRVGGFLLGLASEFDAKDWLDPLDVAAVALSMGFEGAAPFVKAGPQILTLAARRGQVGPGLSRRRQA